MIVVLQPIPVGPLHSLTASRPQLNTATGDPQVKSGQLQCFCPAAANTMVVHPNPAVLPTQTKRSPCMSRNRQDNIL